MNTMDQETRSAFLRRSLPMFAFSLMLRPLVTNVGPVLPEIRAEFGMTAAQGSLLTTLPIVCFGLGSFFVPKLLAKRSPNAVVALVLLVLTGAGLIRLVPNVGALLAGTVVIGLAIAVGNVTMSVVNRRDFTYKLGWITGLVTAGISVSASLAALTSFPISHAFGSWRVSMAMWAVLPLLVLGLWKTYKPAEPDAPLPSSVHISKLVRNKMAWGLLLYFGLQSSMYYSMVTWMPSILRDAGLSPEHAGSMVALLTFFGIPTGLLVPPLAARVKSQVGLSLLFVGIGMLGMCGLLWSPTQLTALWAIMLGCALGSTFPLSLTLVLLRSDGPATARDLGMMMQGGGYFISALGPFLLGAVHDKTNSWHIALVGLLIAMAVQAAVGVYVSRPIVVHEAT